ncbi:MAG: FAD-binding oxidoreductase [Ilumatobacteraceae bacterium]
MAAGAALGARWIRRPSRRSRACVRRRATRSSRSALLLGGRRADHGGRWAQRCLRRADPRARRRRARSHRARGLVEVDEVSGIVAVLAGTFGPDLEDELRERHGLTVGHFPQSFELATVGGWVACRGAGQYSTRYGKIEQMVVGLEVVLADGTVVRTGGAPAAATGPDLGQLFIGSGERSASSPRSGLRARPLPEVEQRASYLLSTLDEDSRPAGRSCAAVRRHRAAALRRRRVVDAGGDGSNCLLLVLDEGEPVLVAATMDVAARCAGGSRQEPSQSTSGSSTATTRLRCRH